MTITAALTFDIKPRAGKGTTSLRRAYMSPEPTGGGAYHVRQAVDRAVRFWEVPVDLADEAVRRRMTDIYLGTLQGILPMDYTDDDDGAVKVVFDDPLIVETYLNGKWNSVRVTLREWFG